MTTVQEIEDAIRKLPAAEFAVLREWLAEFEAKSWDEEFEEDVAAGRLDHLAKEALEDHKAGRTTDL